MVKIKAKKGCKYCGGTGTAVPFFGPDKDLCICIKKQIQVVKNK
jgi:hypothetical protein